MSNSNSSLLARATGAVIAEGASVHESCLIGQGAEIGAEAVLGADVVVGKFASISGEVKIERGVSIHEFTTLVGPLHIAEGSIIGPGGVIGMMQAGSEHRKTHIMKCCRVGKAVQILAGLQVGRHARIRAGSLVIGDVPHYGLVSQNPAALEHYACPNCGGQLSQIRLIRGAVDTRCEACGNDEYRFAVHFWKEALNRVLLPNHISGELVSQIGTDPGWCDEKEFGKLIA